MTDGGAGPRRYGEKEIALILKRATEMQVAEPSAANPSGMTLEELAEIAVEAGIDPRFLRRAAVEVDSGTARPSIWSSFTGDALAVTYETILPGELAESGFEHVVAVIQRVAREHGQPSLLGRTLTWQSETPTKSRSLMVVVSSRNGETTIRVEERLHQLAGQIFGGGVGGVGVGAGVGFGLPLGMTELGSALFAAAFPVGVVGLSYIACREIYRGVVRRRRRALSELFDGLVREVTGRIGEGTVASASSPHALPDGR